MPTKTIDQSWVRIPGSYAGCDCDRGQLIPRFAMRNEERLLRLEYIKPWEPPTGWQPVSCPECGAEFIERAWFEGHFERRHAERVQRLPARGDRESDVQYSERVMAWKEQQDEIEQRRQDREIQRMAPNLEKTLATAHGA